MPLGVALIFLALAASAAEARPRAVPAAGVASTVVELRGVAGKVRAVHVGSRKAKIVKRRPLRIAVPIVRAGAHPIRVRTNRGRHRIRFRVLAPFRGRFTATPDERRVVRNTIGKAGGTVTATGADGTTYTLVIRAGALASDVPVALTPAKVGGLPGRELGGARMEPSGTKFAQPATLTITRTRASKRPLIGLHGTSKGTDARWVASARRGRAIALPIRHFSDAGIAEVDASGYTQLLDSIVAGATAATEGDVADFVEALDGYELVSPGACAQQLQLCVAAKVALADRVDDLAKEVFLNEDTYEAIAHLKQLELLRGRVGAEGDYANYKGSILQGLMEAAGPLAASAPHGTSAPAFLQLRDEEYALADIDGSGAVSQLEWLRFLWRAALIVGSAQVAAEGETLVLAGLRRQLADGDALCLAGDPAGAPRLHSGRAAAADTAEIAAYDAAIAACTVGMGVTPAEVTLGPGESVQLTATGRQNETFTWTASAGTVSPSGLYTAPQAVGTYTVTATSSLSPSRKATTTVNVRSFLTALFKSNGGSIDAAAGADAPSGETPSAAGNCDVLDDTPVDASAASWSAAQQCTRTSSWGSGTGTTNATLNRSPAGQRLRTIQIESHSTASATWGGPDVDNRTRGEADGALIVAFLVEETMPYQLTGSLDLGHPGGDSQTRARLVLYGNPDDSSVPDVLKLHDLQDQNANPQISHSGTLPPGDYYLEVSTDLEAQAGKPIDETKPIVTSASGNARAQARLTLDPGP